MRACPFLLGEIAKAVGGELVGDARVAGVSTDTRDVLKDQLFVALKGDRFDAHDFVAQAVAGGAAALLVSRPVAVSVPCVIVRDTLHALGELASFHRARIGVPAIALTGSNGKTTTKEMIAAILGASRRVLKTEGNLNNLIGVPMTLLGLSKEHDVAVIEMGMNTPGEIARYTEITRPRVGLVLNVGPAHIGMLGSLDAIGDAKGELYAGLDRENDIAIVNADDPQVLRVAEASGVKHRRTFGRAVGSDVRLMSYGPLMSNVPLTSYVPRTVPPLSSARTEGGLFAADRARAPEVVAIATYLIDGVKLEVELTISGEHNAMNAAGAIAACTAGARGIADATHEEIRRGLRGASYVARRMVFEPVGSWLVVDDCYNANSASMIAAIETVRARAAAANRRFVAVLGEMRELGAFAEAEHAKVGRAIADAKPAFVTAFGPLAAPIAREAADRGIDARHEPEDVEALWTWLKPRLQDGDIILVKGSRGIKMERFIEKLREGAK